MARKYIRAHIRGILLSLALLSIPSCEDRIKPSNNETGVSVRSGEASFEAGSTFVSVTASGTWIIGLEFEQDAEPWAELNTERGSGNKTNVILKYEKNPTDRDRTLRIAVASSGKTTECTFVQKAGPGEDPNPPAPGPGASTGWLELPATPEGLEFHVNHFSMGGQTYRNYSYAYDKEALVAHWVAYPLSSVYLGSQGRTDKWAYDPNVPENEQPKLMKGFSASGSDKYDRGHQLPSADRTCCREANEQTFYFTNMTPQRGTKFNQRIWASFETNVRDWSRSADTLYVVTGCFLGNSTKTANDNEGKAVRVPQGYFKALLWYSSTSTLTSQNAGFRGAAFYLEHIDYDQNGIDKSMSMSIDELEELVGMDFFPNLEAKVGKTIADRIEAADPKNDTFWWN